MTEAFHELATHLRRYHEVVADEELRVRDPETQLEQLKSVSAQIADWRSQRVNQVPPRLNHFLDGYSYGKALAWVEETLQG